MTLAFKPSAATVTDFSAGRADGAITLNGG